MGFVSMQTKAVFSEYLGWIRFSETEKIQLLIEEKKDNIVREFKELASYLTTTVVDYTEDED